MNRDSELGYYISVNNLYIDRMPTFMENLAGNYLVCCLLTHTPALLKLPGRLPNTLLSSQKKNIVQEMTFSPY